MAAPAPHRSRAWQRPCAAWVQGGGGRGRNLRADTVRRWRGRPLVDGRPLIPPQRTGAARRRRAHDLEPKTA
eukprot:12276540-Alexandrium_andersonii.AAC.1